MVGRSVGQFYVYPTLLIFVKNNIEHISHQEIYLVLTNKNLFKVCKITIPSRPQEKTPKICRL